MSVDIENAILCTFLLSNDMGEDLTNVYKLNTSIFTSPYRKRIAERINETEDHAYGYLSFLIENDTQGTIYEQDFINILSQTPLGLGFSKKYHDKLIENSKQFIGDRIWTEVEQL